MLGGPGVRLRGCGRSRAFLSSVFSLDSVLSPAFSLAAFLSPAVSSILTRATCWLCSGLGCEPFGGGTRVSAHPSPFDLEACVDIRASTHPVLYCTYMYMYILRELFSARRGKFTWYFRSALFKRRPPSPSRYPAGNRPSTLTPRLASASDQATWQQLRKRRDLDRATGVLGFARRLYDASNRTQEVFVWEQVIA